MERYSHIESLFKDKQDAAAERARAADQTAWTRSAVEWAGAVLENIEFGDGWTYYDGTSEWTPITLTEFEFRRARCSIRGFRSPAKRSALEAHEYDARVALRAAWIAAGLQVPPMRFYEQVGDTHTVTAYTTADGLPPPPPPPAPAAPALPAPALAAVTADAASVQ